eukprot:TRINITY_DN26416_c0_g1_i1.p1 TRINITY_DN26416_c0_g1~~TRINITY_DN26416_c0_g1_i1.p1  ORF type:complete len:511 (+),score=136.78 TRINITY_DN26416_c0_g1_i1:60-1592(+)
MAAAAGAPAPARRFYGLLGVRRSADDAQIRTAYRRRALATHPDKGGSASEFLEVVEAFEVLSDRGRRAAYDCELLRAGCADGNFGPSSAAAAPSVQRQAGCGAQTTAAAPSGEGTGPAEEKRAASMWHKLLALPLEEQLREIGVLSYRTLERILAYAASQACAGGAPIAAPDVPAASLSAAAVLAPPPPPGNAGGLAARPMDDGTGAVATASAAADSGGEPAPADAAACPPAAKRPRHGPPTVTVTAAPGASGAGAAVPGANSRAWVCLERLKVCTGAAEDVAEAINWHIMLVRIKQFFDERLLDGSSFDDAARAAVAAVLADNAAEGGADPRLRYVNEYPVAGEPLFTPPSRDIDVALRQRAELEQLWASGAGREEVLAAIRRMTVASSAAAEDQKLLLERLRRQLRSFLQLIRRPEGRPPGINAAFVSSRNGERTAVIYAELWRPSPGGLELLCRGPRRRRVDEALGDLAALRAARSGAGDPDAAACERSRQLYEEVLRSGAGGAAAT